MTPQAIASTNKAQEEFDKRYITASEIMRELGIGRAAMAYARHNRLPQAIVLNEGTLFIWERETIQPFLDSWKKYIDARKGL